MATTTIPNPPLAAPTPSSIRYQKIPFRIQFDPVRSSSSSSKAGSSSSIKCSNASVHNANASNEHINNGGGLKNLVSVWTEELINKVPKNSVIFHAFGKGKNEIEEKKIEIEKMKECINQLKSRVAEEKRECEAQQSEIMKMKEYINKLTSRFDEVEKCQLELSEAIALVEEAGHCLQDVKKALQNG